jgi:hypothetical protein
MGRTIPAESSRTRFSPEFFEQSASDLLCGITFRNLLKFRAPDIDFCCFGQMFHIKSNRPASPSRQFAQGLAVIFGRFLIVERISCFDGPWRRGMSTIAPLSGRR